MSCVLVSMAQFLLDIKNCWSYPQQTILDMSDQTTKITASQPLRSVHLADAKMLIQLLYVLETNGLN